MIRELECPHLVRDLRALLPPAPRRGIVRLYVEDDARLFRERAVRDGAYNAEAYYAPVRKAVYLQEATIERSLAHEVVHAIMDLDWGVTEPLWFAEGTAEAVSLRYRTGEWPEAVNAELACPALLTHDRALMYGRDFQLHYEVAQKHVSYLVQHDPVHFTDLLRRRI